MLELELTQNCMSALIPLRLPYLLGPIARCTTSAGCSVISQGCLTTAAEMSSAQCGGCQKLTNQASPLSEPVASAFQAAAVLEVTSRSGSLCSNQLSCSSLRFDRHGCGSNSVRQDLGGVLDFDGGGSSFWLHEFDLLAWPGRYGHRFRLAAVQGPATIGQYRHSDCFTVCPTSAGSIWSFSAVMRQLVLPLGLGKSTRNSLARFDCGLLDRGLRRTR